MINLNQRIPTSSTPAQVVDQTNILQNHNEPSIQEDAAYRVKRRNGDVTVFDREKIRIAITKAFRAVEPVKAHSQEVINKIGFLANEVCSQVKRSTAVGFPIDIETIQNHVELALLYSGEQEVARAYIIYREEHARMRREREQTEQEKPLIVMLNRDGKEKPLDVDYLAKQIGYACEGISNVEIQRVLDRVLESVYQKIPFKKLFDVMILGCRSLVEIEPNYSYVAGRLFLDKTMNEAMPIIYPQRGKINFHIVEGFYPAYFEQYIHKAIAFGLLDSRLESFDLSQLGAALVPERDRNFDLMGFNNLYDRYLIKYQGRKDQHIELPQALFMRVAMGLALNEEDKNAKAIEFYNLLSSFDFMCSTPTLFNSGTPRPQLSSCYLSTIGDDLEQIFDGIKDNALLSKYAGGLGNDWTPVRALGSFIQGTQGDSQGVIPFLRIASTTAHAVNQGGKRKGALCSYLETWHLDIEEFLILHRNTGDERRKTPEMNTANWVPDLFMKRLSQDGEWTLFSPNEVPDLHDLYGQAFETRYEYYESLAREGKIKSKTLQAKKLWREMVEMLFETGHPWITFKDPCNIRSPQQHVGVVHSSNLCTEITLNTTTDEIAVCNLGSLNLVNHVTDEGLLNVPKIKYTVSVAMRMLDNVIDYNYYSVDKARQSNMKHRPVGLGIMGFQDVLQKLNISYASDKAVLLADRSMEIISYSAISASADLAEERGAYSSFPGSLWSKGILPIDSVAMLQEQRQGWLKQDSESTLKEWDELRDRIKRVGLRNSNTLAIAPTATIANIVGVSPSIESSYSNLYVKSNLSGEFLSCNHYLVSALKKQGLWDEAMLEDLKVHDGSIQKIDRIPDDIKQVFLTSFEIKPSWLIESASRRQKWLDQAQSLNLFAPVGVNGKYLDEMYRLAWIKGLKTTYYLRSNSATNVEKGTVKSNQLSISNAPAPVARSLATSFESAKTQESIEDQSETDFCGIDREGCESCSG